MSTIYRHILRPILLLCSLYISFVVYTGVSTVVHTAGHIDSDMYSIDIVESTYAEVGVAGIAGYDPPSAAPTVAEKSTSTTDIWNLIIKSLTLLVVPFAMLAGWLLSPEWTSGDLFGLRSIIYNIWIFSSNIAYFAYAILLIFSAVATMVWPEKTKFHVSAMLPKIALGIIIIPITWWAINAVVSFSSYLTVAVVSMPGEMINTMGIADGGLTKDAKGDIPLKIVMDTTKKNATAFTTSCNPAAGVAIDPKFCVNSHTFLTTKLNSGPLGLINSYIYGIFKIQNMQTIFVGTDFAQTIKNVLNLGIDAILSVLVTLALTIILIVFCFVFAWRAMRLWGFMAFSPIITLLYVVTGSGEKETNSNITEFLGLAFIPVIVSGILAFGFLFLSLLQQNIPTTVTSTATSTYNPGIPGTPSKPSENIFTVGPWEMKILGAPVSAGTSETGDRNFFVRMMLTLLGVAIFYLCIKVMSASSKIAAAAIKPLEPALGLVKSLPMYAPLPIPGGSLGGLSKIGELPGQLKSQMDSQKRDKIRADYGKYFNLDTGGPSNTAVNTFKTKYTPSNTLADSAKYTEMRGELNALMQGADYTQQTTKDLMKAVATSLRESPSSYRYLNDDIKTLVLKDPKEWKDEDLNRITANVLKNDTLSISNKEAIAILNTYKKKTASAAGAGGAAGTASSVPTQMNFNGISVNIGLAPTGETIALNTDRILRNLNTEASKIVAQNKQVTVDELRDMIKNTGVQSADIKTILDAIQKDPIGKTVIKTVSTPPSAGATLKKP